MFKECCFHVSTVHCLFLIHTPRNVLGTFSKEEGQAAMTGVFLHDSSEVSYACAQASKEGS